MNHTPTASSSEDTFGPGILSIGPSTLLLLVFPIRFIQIYRCDIKARPGLLLGCKLIAVALFACIQLALLVLWSLPSTTRTRASVAASALSFANSLAICVLSYTEHTRSIRPSSILGSYIFFSTIFDIAQARTLWLNTVLSRSQSYDVAALFTTSLAIKVALLVLEATEKRSLLIGSYKQSTREATSSIFNRSVFWWVNSLFKRGFRSLIAIEDLSGIGETFSSRGLGDTLQQAWNRNNKSGNHPLIITVFWTFKWTLFVAIIPRLCFVGFSFAQPFLINRSISLVSEPWTPDSRYDGYGIIAATALIFIGLSISRALYNHKTYQTITIFRGSLISLIYNKSTLLALSTVDDSAVVTHMSTDIDSIAKGIANMHEIWSSIIELGIGIYLLERQVRAACVLVIVPAILCSVATTYLAKGMGPARMVWNRGIQKRVAITSSTLSQVKGVKLLGLTDQMSNMIQRLRITELDLSKNFRGMIVWLNMVANLSDQLTPIVVIAAAVFWTSASRGAELSVAQAFTAMSIIILVLNPLTNLIAAYPKFMSAVGCFDRIQIFLLSEERKDHRLIPEYARHTSRTLEQDGSI